MFNAARNKPKAQLICVSPCCNNTITHAVFYVHCSNNSHCRITALNYHHHWQFDEAQLGRFIVVL